MRIVLSFWAITAIGVAQSMLVSTELDDALKPHVAILSYGTQEYNQALSELLGDVRGTAGLTSILPFSIILRNISSKPLLMTSVLFQVEDQTGKIDNHAFTNIDLASSSPGHLQSKGARLVALSNAANHAIASKRLNILESVQPSLFEVASDLAKSRRITVMIDGVITSEGVLVGPDRISAFRRIQQEQRANTFIVSQVAKHATLDPSAIAADLATLASITPGPSKSPVDRDFYNLKVSRTAKHLLSVLNAGGVEAIRSMLERLEHEVIVKKQ